MKILVLICLIFTIRLSAIEKNMVVIVPSYNNFRYFKSNLDSILNQSYQNFRILYVNDCSTDGTGERIEKYLQQNDIDYSSLSFENNTDESLLNLNVKFCEKLKSEKHFFTLVHNKKRAGAMANIYRAIHSLEDSDVVILIDGDDRLSHTDVITRLNTVYNSEKEIWMTHGTLIEYPSRSTNWCEAIPDEIIKRNRFRKFKCPSHLKTFYSWLFKKIDINDLLYDGEFFQATSDMAFMFPICEMARERHEFIPEVNYVYNMSNNLNDNKINPQMQNDLDFLIRNRLRYQPLRGSEIPEFMRRDK